MAKAHVLDTTSENTINAAVHFLTPIGNNAAGIAWSVVLEAIGLLGVHGGHAVGAELTQIEAGEVIELTIALQVNPADTDDPALLAEAERVIAAKKAEYAARYNYYGQTVGSVD